MTSYLVESGLIVGYYASKSDSPVFKIRFPSFQNQIPQFLSRIFLPLDDFKKSGMTVAFCIMFFFPKIKSEIPIDLLEDLLKGPEKKIWGKP